MLSLYWWTKQTSSCFNGVYSPSRKATNDQFIMPIIICCYNQLYRGKAQDVLRVYNMDLIYSLGFPDEMVLVVNQKNDGFGFRYRSKKKNSGQKELFWELLRQEGNWHSHRTNWVRQNNMRLGGNQTAESTDYADSDYNHEMKRHLFFGRKAMTNLDSILKIRDITLPAKVHLVKAMVFPVFMYGFESWTTKKAEHWRIDAFVLWCWRRILRVS